MEQTSTPTVRKDGFLPLGRDPVEREVHQIVVGELQIFAVRGPEALYPGQCHQDRLVLRTGFEWQDLKALKEQGALLAVRRQHEWQIEVASVRDMLIAVGKRARCIVAEHFTHFGHNAAWKWTKRHMCLLA